MSPSVLGKAEIALRGAGEGSGSAKRCSMSLNNRLYDEPGLAAAYDAVSAENICNAEYERPAIRALLGEVRGLRVLDAGCAAGDHAAWIAENGGAVSALDVSAAMVERTKQRLGADARVLRADLAERLPFDDSAFDLVLSSMALHYLPSWEGTLREFVRVLVPGGRLVFSTHHPYLTLDGGAPYHEVRLVTDTWSDFGPEPIEVRFYHRPLERIVRDVIDAGFTIRAMLEPKPTPRAHERDAAFAQRLLAHPWFLIVDAVR
jgi:SAM-dependent methyltransferase